MQKATEQVQQYMQKLEASSQIGESKQVIKQESKQANCKNALRMKIRGSASKLQECMQIIKRDSKQANFNNRAQQKPGKLETRFKNALKEKARGQEGKSKKTNNQECNNIYASNQYEYLQPRNQESMRAKSKNVANIECQKLSKEIVRMPATNKISNQASTRQGSKQVRNEENRQQICKYTCNIESNKTGKKIA